MEETLVTEYEYQAAHDVAISWFSLSVFVSTTNILTNLYLAYFIDCGLFLANYKIGRSSSRIKRQKSFSEDFSGKSTCSPGGVELFLHQLPKMIPAPRPSSRPILVGIARSVKTKITPFPDTPNPRGWKCASLNSSG